MCGNRAPVGALMPGKYGRGGASRRLGPPSSSLRVRDRPHAGFDAARPMHPACPLNLTWWGARGPCDSQCPSCRRDIGPPSMWASAMALSTLSSAKSAALSSGPGATARKAPISFQDVPVPENARAVPAQRRRACAHVEVDPGISMRGCALIPQGQPLGQRAPTRSARRARPSACACKLLNLDDYG